LFNNTVKKFIMRAKFLLTVWGTIFSAAVVFAQSGSEPQLATAGDNKLPKTVNAHTTSVKPVLSATSVSGNERSEKQTATIKHKAAPRFAATNDNGNATDRNEPVKKKN